MKRTLALVLAAFIALSLTACGNSMEAEDIDRALDIAEQLVEKLPEEIELDSIIAETPEEEPAEQPEIEEPEAEEPKAEEPKAEEPKTEEPKVEQPKVEEPKKEEPKKEEPKTEAPVVTAPEKEEKPMVEAPVTNEFFNPNNNFYDINAVSVKPRHVYWDENGYLVAECFVINGYNRPVHTIAVKSLSFSNNDCVIASGSFGGLPGLTLQPYTHYIWTFRFHPNDVVTKGADLSKLNFRYSTTSKF